MEVGIPIAFLAGLLSFLSPCILPLVLPYISLISGVSISSIKAGSVGKGERVRIIISTFYFVIGFTVVFIVFGVVAGQVGGFLVSLKDILSRVAGVTIVIFGLHLLGILKIPFLDYEKRINNFSPDKSNFFTSFVMGLLFAFGWTPCIGPILGSIVGIAFYGGNVYYGALLLGVYSLGLAIPFFVVSIFVDSAVSIISSAKKLVRFVEIFSGIILVLVGIALITNTLGIISGIILEIFPFLGKLG